MISFSIGFTVLRKNMKLNFDMSKFIIKPIIATAIMGVCSYFIYSIVAKFMVMRLATIIALISAVIIYGMAVIVLNILTKEEIYMIPYGQKIYELLEKMGIYKKKKTI